MVPWFRGEVGGTLVALGATAAVATAGYTGFLVGPPAIGLVSEAFGGLQAGLAVVALLGVVVALLADQARRAEAGPHAGTTPMAEAAADH
jgi:MFS family permease